MSGTSACWRPDSSLPGGRFVRYFVEVPLPAAQVERVVFASPAEWLSAMAGAERCPRWE